MCCSDSALFVVTCGVISRSRSWSPAETKGGGVVFAAVGPNKGIVLPRLEEVESRKKTKDGVAEDE